MKKKLKEVAVVVSFYFYFFLWAARCFVRTCPVLVVEYMFCHLFVGFGALGVRCVCVCVCTRNHYVLVWVFQPCAGLSCILLSFFFVRDANVFCVFGFGALLFLCAAVRTIFSPKRYGSKVYCCPGSIQKYEVARKTSCVTNLTSSLPCDYPRLERAFTFLYVPEPKGVRVTSKIHIFF